MTKEVEEELREQISRQRQWEAMSYAQKNTQLFLNQKELLDKFLACHAINPIVVFDYYFNQYMESW